MALIAKRKLTETWREAVGRRAAASGLHDEGTAAFDRLRQDGQPEVDAAFRSLEALGLLWPVDLPGEREVAATPPDEVPAV